MTVNHKFGYSFNIGPIIFLELVCLYAHNNMKLRRQNSG